MKTSCPSCEKSIEYQAHSYWQSVEMKGKLVKFIAASYKCPLCGELFDTAETLNGNLEAARMAYANPVAQTPKS